MFTLSWWTTRCCGGFWEIRVIKIIFYYSYLVFHGILSTISSRSTVLCFSYPDKEPFTNYTMTNLECLYEVQKEEKRKTVQHIGKKLIFFYAMRYKRYGFIFFQILDQQSTLRKSAIDHIAYLHQNGTSTIADYSIVRVQNYKNI